MEKLTLEHIAPFGKGLKAESKNGLIEIFGLCYESERVLNVIGSATVSIKDIKLYLRPMDLTKPITINGKEVIPFKELTRLYYPDMNDCNIKFDDLRSNYIQVLINGNGIVNQVHRINLHFDTMRGCQIKYLYANKFDVDGLIYAGLAIDVNTLETNPYNS